VTGLRSFAGRRRRRPESQRLSLCAVTKAGPSRAGAFLEQWRPLVDEIVVAVDESAPPGTASACASIAEQVYLVPAAMANMERYLGWLHSRCSGEWILRADDDELPSEALREVLRSLLDEREPTHYWLPRIWMHPTPETYIAERVWLRDIQVRLVRNLPGLWRFSGRLHSNIEVTGASRIVEAPLLHLALLVADLEQRRAKVEAYERVTPDLRHESGAPLNGVFVPEDMGVTVLERSRQADVGSAARYLQAARRPEGKASPAGEVPVVSMQEIERWNGERAVSPGAYQARVTLPQGAEPMEADAIQHVQVEVTNLGEEWLARGPQPEPPIQVGYRWWREDGTEIARPTLRTPFTETVAPGATTRLTMAIQAPPEYGRLQLRVDLVHEGVRWFECEEQLEVDVSPGQSAPAPVRSGPMTIADRIGDLDTSLFEPIESQTTEPDRQSLLALHAAIALRGPFDYLEIGSHLGGSLQAMVADPRCRSIVSIDPRPLSQPDDRGRDELYPENSTERMLELLGAIPDADLAKLETFERGTDQLSVAELPTRPAFCFIDGEHTRAAALRDARFCLEATTADGVIAFHDSNVVLPGIEDFIAELGRPHHAFQMPDSVFVVELGAARLWDTPYVQRALIPMT